VYGTVELQRTVAPVSPIWTTVDPWKPQTQQPLVAVAGLPVMGVGSSPQMYQGSTLVVSPYGFVNTALPAVHQAPVGMPPFSGSQWPTPPQHQQVPFASLYLLGYISVSLLNTHRF